MELTPYLALMVSKTASDMFFSVGAPPAIKIEGVISYVGQHDLQPGAVRDLAYSVMTDKQVKEFESTLECNFSISQQDSGRFRVNIYRQRGEVAMVIRYIRSHIPAIAELNLPLILESLVMHPRGLVLLVGATGSGKSTTLASMIDYRNTHRAGHILTIEEPIEFIHRHKQSIVDQREVGLDTLSYANALKNAMREAPDVILIGEIRDRDTMQHAIAYAETGHLCLSTLHANNAYQAVERIINFFPEHVRPQVLEDLSMNLRAIVSQRLLRSAEGGARVPAVEVMLNTPYIADLILKGEIELIHDAMTQSGEHGMQTFDDALYRLVKDGRITQQEALDNADSRNNLSVRLRLESGAGIGDDDLVLEQ